jgi:hypothetical protein
MGGVGTSILGRPRHLPRDRRASHHPTSDYTLNCEEPHKVVAKRVAFVRELDVLSVLEDGCVGQTGHTEVRDMLR